MKKTLGTLAAVLILAAAPSLFADPGGPGAMMGAFDPLVAPDGTVLTLRINPAMDGGGAQVHGTGMELVAVDPSGSIAWTYESEGGIHDLVIVNNLVIFAVVDGGQFGWWDGVDDEANTTVVALTLAAGTSVWKLELEAVVRNIEAATDRIYAVSGGCGMETNTVRRTTRHPRGGMGPGAGPGSGPGDGSCGVQTLFAIGLDGSTLWTLPLND